MLPTYWLTFVDSNGLTARQITLTEQVDLSGVGAELCVLTPEQSNDELSNAWPGVAVAKLGYVPVASCSLGSGDYYYINTGDGANGPLYRIYHDEVTEDADSVRDAVVIVLERFEALLMYL